MKLLVTGGAGYIGSHTCLELLAQGHDVCVVDSLVNSQVESLHRVERLSGRSITFYQLDLLDEAALEQVVTTWRPEAVIHFAGLKAVGESIREPVRYYANNLIGTLNLLQVMARADVRQLIFSSSATVYGNATQMPLREDAPLGATNPYGRTKLMIEEQLRDLAAADPNWYITILRYFNPVGAHESGQIGEDPTGIPNNLFPFITQVAIGARARLQVFGHDYPTLDGTCIRDYLHVMDLAEGHVAALRQGQTQTGLHTYNLGTGRGQSVLEVVEAFEQANQVKIPYVFSERRAGDSAITYADATLAAQELGWQAKRTLAEMCRDGWRWQVQNPNGYRA